MSVATGYRLQATSCLPNFTEQFAAHTFAARLAARHNALRRCHDGYTESALDTLDFVTADVNTAAGTRDPRQISNGRFASAVLQVHAENHLAILFLCLEVRNIALFLENAGNLGLQLRSRNIQLLMTRPDRVPDPRQKICYRVTQTHSFSFIPRSLPVSPSIRRTRGNVHYSFSYQFSVFSTDLLPPASILQLRTDN